jgi:hypothetical protein
MTDYLDEPVEITEGGTALRVSADAMRALAKATGRSVSELLQGDDSAEGEADRIQAIAFLELHKRAARAGHLPDAGTLWEHAGAVEIVMAPAPPPRSADPLDTDSSKTSPPSVAIGE